MAIALYSAELHGRGEGTAEFLAQTVGSAGYPWSGQAAAPRSMR